MLHAWSSKVPQPQQLYKLSVRRDEMYAGCVRTLLINHNHINVKKMEQIRVVNG